MIFILFLSLVQVYSENKLKLNYNSTIPKLLLIGRLMSVFIYFYCKKFFIKFKYSKLIAIDLIFLCFFIISVLISIYLYIGILSKEHFFDLFFQVSFYSFVYFYLFHNLILSNMIIIYILEKNKNIVQGSVIVIIGILIFSLHILLDYLV